MENGTFVPVHKNDQPENIRIFGSIFIEKFKRDEQGMRHKRP